MALLNVRAARNKTRFAITHSYGRTGNNIQQVLIAIAHAEVFRGVLDVERDSLIDGRLVDLINTFSLDFSPGLPVNNVFQSKFFHYTEYSFCQKDLSRAAFKREILPRRECLLSRDYIERSLWRVAQSYVLQALIVPEVSIRIEDRLVIHLRSGDVASLSHDYYGTNPLCFYRQFAKLYDDVVVVMEPGHRYVLLESLVALF